MALLVAVEFQRALPLPDCSKSVRGEGFKKTKGKEQTWGQGKEWRTPERREKGVGRKQGGVRWGKESGEGGKERKCDCLLSCSGSCSCLGTLPAGVFFSFLLLILARASLPLTRWNPSTFRR